MYILIPFDNRALFRFIQFRFKFRRISNPILINDRVIRNLDPWPKSTLINWDKIWPLTPKNSQKTKFYSSLSIFFETRKSMIEKLGNYALTTKKSHLLVYYTISSCLCGQINACIKQLTKQAIYFTGSFSLASRLSLACLKKSETSYFESLIKIHFFVRFLSAFGLSSFLTRLMYRVQFSEKY